MAELYSLHLDFSMFLVQVLGSARMISWTQMSYFHSSIKEMNANEGPWVHLVFLLFQSPAQSGETFRAEEPITHLLWDTRNLNFSQEIYDF